MDAVLSSLLATTNRLNASVLPLVIDSVVWQERRPPLCQGDRSAKEHLRKPGQLFGTTILDRETSAPKVLCENGELMKWVPSFASYAYEISILPHHAPLAEPDTLKYLPGPEIGEATMPSESDPDEKTSGLGAVSAMLYRVGNGS